MKGTDSIEPMREVLRRHPCGLKGVDQGRLVGIAQRHAANEHFVLTRAHQWQDNFGKTVPGRLRASVQATRSGCHHEALQEHAVVEQTASAHDFLDGEHQAHGRIEEFVIALVLVTASL